jgi:integrase
MTRQLVIVGTSGSSLLPRQLAYQRAVEEAERYVRNQRTERTRRAYQMQWRRWGQHCAEHDIAPLPIAPDELIRYLSMRTKQGAAPNTLRLALAALCVIDQASRVTPHTPQPASLRHDLRVRAWLKGWSRENAIAPRRQAPSIAPRELDRLLQAAAERPAGVSAAQHVAQYARDRAFLLLGIGAALRVSELVALGVGDVQRVERGLRVHVRRSKTDQHGAGAITGVSPQARLLRCPVDAWAVWLALRGDWEGPAFTGIARDGSLVRAPLSDSGARRIVTRRAAAVGLELSSHSMRATLATLASERGRSIHKIARHGRWSKLDTVSGYVRQGELFDDNVSAGLLDD